MIHPRGAEMSEDMAPQEMDENLYQKIRMKEENDFVARLLRPYSTFLVKYPSVVVLLLIVTLIFSAVLSTIPAAGAKNFPDFSDPTKGFEARGTTISSRQVAYFNLGRETYRQLASRTRRSANIVAPRTRRSANNIFWSGNLNGVYIEPDFVMIYEHIDGGNLMASMQSICEMHQEKIMKAENYRLFFHTAHNLPNYIAILANKTDCSDITQNDIDSFFSRLKSCVTFYKDLKYKHCIDDPSRCSDISPTCRRHANIPDEQDFASFIYNSFFYLADAEFQNDVTSLRQVASIDMYNFSSTSFFESLYEDMLIDLDDAVYGNIKIVAYKMADFKFDIFQTAVIFQSLFIVSAIFLVIIFIWFYSGSIFIALMTIGCVLFATLISYFVYGRVFDMDFFPFLNMVTTIFIVGIGADDAFVYTGIWEEAKLVYVIKNAADHVEYLIKWTTHTLRHALLAMFVTSLTTAAAFYSNISSRVTSVKCFGLYSGTAIIVNYLLMVTFFPVVVILHDKYLSACMHSCCPGVCKVRPEVRTDEQPFELTASNELQQVPVVKRKSPQAFVMKVQKFVDNASEKIFENYLPRALYKFRFVLVLLLSLLGVGGIIVTFVEPGLSLPSTGEFQMFQSSNSLEQYELYYKKKFSFGESSSKGTQYLTLVFGVKAVDNGNVFNPDDYGTLEYDQPLDVFTEHVWLYNLCKNMRNQSFYVSSETCDKYETDFIGVMLSACSSGDCCNHSLPIPKNDFNTCFLRKRSLLEGFDDNNNMLALTISVETSYRKTDGYDYNEDLFNTMEKWFDEQMKDTSFNGFWYIEQRFYDLQLSLFKGTKESLAIAIAVAFVVILVTTLNALLSIYSILTITFIISVTVGILVLSGWKLNIMESVVFSVAAGLSADFTLHYSVAYKTSFIKTDRVVRVKNALSHIGPAILMGAFTTFVAGLVMIPSSVLVYIQMAQFLMLVMVVSWIFSSLFFLSLCAVVGPNGNFCQLSNPMKSYNNCREAEHVNTLQSRVQSRETVISSEKIEEERKNDTKSDQVL